LALTRRLREAGSLLGLGVLDHVIVTGRRRYQPAAEVGPR
jgi:DNA repair protein RadC